MIINNIFNSVFILFGCKTRWLTCSTLARFPDHDTKHGIFYHFPHVDDIKQLLGMNGAIQKLRLASIAPFIILALLLFGSIGWVGLFCTNLALKGNRRFYCYFHTLRALLWLLPPFTTATVVVYGIMIWLYNDGGRVAPIVAVQVINIVPTLISMIMHLKVKKIPLLFWKPFKLQFLSGSPEADTFQGPPPAIDPNDPVTRQAQRDHRSMPLNADAVGAASELPSASRTIGIAPAELPSRSRTKRLSRGVSRRVALEVIPAACTSLRLQQQNIDSASTFKNL